MFIPTWLLVLAFFLIPGLADAVVGLCFAAVVIFLFMIASPFLLALYLVGKLLSFLDNEFPSPVAEYPIAYRLGRFIKKIFRL